LLKLLLSWRIQKAFYPRKEFATQEGQKWLSTAALDGSEGCNARIQTCKLYSGESNKKVTNRKQPSGFQSPLKQAIREEYQG
jgi:hypothetical protein